jgi:hypothetical protein
MSDQTNARLNLQWSGGHAAKPGFGDLTEL